METVTLKKTAWIKLVHELGKGFEERATKSDLEGTFYRKNILERLFRDVQASDFHPLPKWDQYAFTGNFILNQK